MRRYRENATTLSADALEVLFEMERQLGRREGYAEALYDCGPQIHKLPQQYKESDSAFAARKAQLMMSAKDDYADRAAAKYPLPESPDSRPVAVTSAA